jgi:molybdate transport system substrate-binding protein
MAGSKQGNAGAVAEEQFSATPSMEIKNKKTSNLFYRVCSSFFVIHFLLFLCCVVPGSEQVYAAEINIAVASNFKSTLQKIGADFKRATGHDLVISSASSGKLFAQIKHGAPYDVFLSADEKLPDQLIRDKLATSESAHIYALGKLVLIANLVTSSGCEDIISSNRLNHLAIANPEIAPYGQAARQVLQKLELWQQLQPRIVIGENAAQTLHFVSSKNAEAGFIARSMLFMARNAGKTLDSVCVWNVPADMYAPIKQKMVLLNKAKDKPAVLAFVQYMQSATAKAIIKSSGYDVL